jgi:hypothetical protein
MKTEELKARMLNALDPGADPGTVFTELGREGVIFDFSERFTTAVLAKLGRETGMMNRETDFSRNLNFAFRSIAVSGVAVIIILLISNFIMNGSFSLNSFLGLTDNYDESIVCLLMGK